MSVAKAELRSQKEKFDELFEKEKAKHDEKDKELRRALAEVKFKEEIINKEMEAEKQHLNVLRTQLEVALRNI